jgi:aryl-alcohol dehydrogenase-like predicted oxidoreductase
VLEFYGSPDNFQRLARLAELARQRGTSVSSVALAYVLDSRMNTFPTLGCRSKREFRECLAATQLRLSPEQVRWLESGQGSLPHF